MSQKQLKQETAVTPTDSFASIDDPRFAFITNKWSRTLVQPLLISILITALLSSLLVLAEIITRTAWMPFSLFLFFVALEGCYTTLWLQQPERRLLNHTAYRAAELLLITLLLRIFAWTVSSTWPHLADIPEILRLPQTIFIDAPFVFVGILSLFAWSQATYLGITFTNLSSIRRRCITTPNHPTSVFQRQARSHQSRRNCLHLFSPMDWWRNGFGSDHRPE